MKATGKLSVKKIILGSVLLLLGIWVGVATFRFYASEQPSDLGSGLRYVGKRVWGCTIDTPLITFCPNGRHVEYYFATDMTLTDVRAHLGDVSNAEESDWLQRESAEYKNIRFEFTNKPSFLFNYFPDGQTVIERYRLIKVNEKHILEVHKEQYQGFMVKK